jgi:hypothetical protein
MIGRLSHCVIARLNTTAFHEEPNNGRYLADFHNMLIAQMPYKENDPNMKIVELYIVRGTVPHNDEIRVEKRNP